MMKTSLFLLTFLLLTVSSALAFPAEKGKECASCHKLTMAEANVLLKGFAEVRAIRQAPVAGMFELEVENRELKQQATVYLDYGKKHLIVTIFDLATRQALGQPPSKAAEKTTLKPETIPLDHSIVLGNPKGTQRLFVFTDPECPYCAKLHWELVKLTADLPELAIYIKLFPLASHPGSYDKARVILGQNSFELLSQAFEGGELPKPGAKDGRKPVDDTIKFAESAGINVTPTLVLPDGRIVAGYMDVDELKKLLTAKP
jgi:thiol:disulfide interchange protein DsbC